jgi:hypothetical protein
MAVEKWSTPLIDWEVRSPKPKAQCLQQVRNPWQVRPVPAEPDSLPAIPLPAGQILSFCKILVPKAICYLLTHQDSAAGQ